MTWFFLFTHASILSTVPQILNYICIIFHNSTHIRLAALSTDNLPVQSLDSIHFTWYNFAYLSLLFIKLTCLSFLSALLKNTPLNHTWESALIHLIPPLADLWGDRSHWPPEAGGLRNQQTCLQIRISSLADHWWRGALHAVSPSPSLDHRWRLSLAEAGTPSLSLIPSCRQCSSMLHCHSAVLCLMSVLCLSVFMSVWIIHDLNHLIWCTWHFCHSFSRWLGEGNVLDGNLSPDPISPSHMQRKYTPLNLVRIWLSNKPYYSLEQHLMSLLLPFSVLRNFLMPVVLISLWFNAQPLIQMKSLFHNHALLPRL